MTLTGLKASIKETIKFYEKLIDSLEAEQLIRYEPSVTSKIVTYKLVIIDLKEMIK